MWDMRLAWRFSRRTEEFDGEWSSRDQGRRGGKQRVRKELFWERNK